MTLAPQVPPSPADAVAQSWVSASPRWLKPWLQLMRLDRPIGAWLLFWPCVMGLVLGAMAQDRSFVDWRDFWYLILFGVGAVLMRAAGCAFNDIVDRKIDAQVARTAGRPIPSGRISVQGAAILTAFLCALGLLILLQFNRFAFFIGLASLILVLAYPYMKRITWWPQAWLGLTFNWGALLGFAAQTGQIDLADLMLYAGLVFWTLGYDTIYAHQDKEDDALIGVKSTARLLGIKSHQFIRGFYAACFTLVLAAGFADHAGWAFLPLMALAGAHMLWQTRKLNIDDPDNCLMLFRANRITGGLMAASFAASVWLG